MNPNTLHLPERLKQWAAPIGVGVLVIFHGVGLWGLLWSGDAHYYQRLTPVNLLLSNLLLFLFHQEWRIKFVLCMLAIAVLGFFAEVLGVHTGLLFGDYQYGASLGPKVWEVPVLIALNWVMLVYCCGSVAVRLSESKWGRIIIAALLMVLLDVLIEPVAIRYDFWTWEHGIVPLQNYVGWLVLSLGFQALFQNSRFTKSNPLAYWLLALQFVFFSSLSLLM